MNAGHLAESQSHFGECIAINSPRPLVVHRVYVDRDGHKVRTVELPASIISHISVRKVEEFLMTMERGIEQRKRSSNRRKQIIDMLSAGAKPLEVALKVGVTSSYVRQVRKEMQ